MKTYNQLMEALEGKARERYLKFHDVLHDFGYRNRGGSSDMVNYNRPVSDHHAELHFGHSVHVKHRINPEASTTTHATPEALKSYLSILHN